MGFGNQMSKKLIPIGCKAFSSGTKLNANTQNDLFHLSCWKFYCMLERLVWCKWGFPRKTVKLARKFSGIRTNSLGMGIQLVYSCVLHKENGTFPLQSTEIDLELLHYKANGNDSSQRLCVRWRKGRGGLVCVEHVLYISAVNGFRFRRNTQDK